MIGALVAAGDDDGDPVAPRGLDGGGERVDPAVLEAVGAVGEVR